METVYKTTESQRACSKKHREKMKAEHRCVRCGMQDERTLSGLVCCECCAEKQRKYGADNAAIYNLHRRTSKKRLREKRKAQGRCTKCGAELPTDDWHCTCVKCREKISKRTAKRSIEPYMVRSEWHVINRCKLIKGLSEAEKLHVCLNCPYPNCVEGES